MDTYDFDMDAWDNMIVSLPVLEKLLEDCNEKLLEGAFLWDHTPEGEEYWYNQYWSHTPLDLDRLLMIYEVLTGEPFESLVDTYYEDGKPDGGPSGYYDLPTDRPIGTLNDLLEWKGDVQWLGDSFHLANITKAGWRWGIKEGTTKAYDSRKFIYSGARLLMKYAGVSEVRKTLQNMLNDPQFKE